MKKTEPEGARDGRDGGLGLSVTARVFPTNHQMKIILDFGCIMGGISICHVLPWWPHLFFSF